jgi:hypothetical protein
MVIELVKKFLSLMELEGSLPCPQEPATKVYSEPDKSSSYPQSPFLYNDYYMPWSPSALFPSSFQTKTLCFCTLHFMGYHKNSFLRYSSELKTLTLNICEICTFYIVFCSLLSHLEARIAQLA